MPRHTRSGARGEHESDVVLPVNPPRSAHPAAGQPHTVATPPKIVQQLVSRGAWRLCQSKMQASRPMQPPVHPGSAGASSAAAAATCSQRQSSLDAHPPIQVRHGLRWSTLLHSIDGSSASGRTSAAARLETCAKRQKPLHPVPRIRDSPLETDRRCAQW